MYSNASGQGALSYTPAALAPIPLQAIFGDNATTAMISSLQTSLKSMAQTALQKAQYEAQLNLLQAGTIPFLELVVFPTGGVASPPAPNVSYITIAVMEVVRALLCFLSLPILTPHLKHPFGRGSVVSLYS